MNSGFLYRKRYKRGQKPKSPLVILRECFAQKSPPLVILNEVKNPLGKERIPRNRFKQPKADHEGTSADFSKQHGALFCRAR